MMFAGWYFIFILILLSGFSRFFEALDEELLIFDDSFIPENNLFSANF